MSEGREFKINFVADATQAVQASKETSSALQEVAQKTEESAEKTQKAATAHEEAAKHTEKHTGHAHALHKIFHKLNEVVPGLGTAMQLAFSPMGAIISGVVLALGYLHEKSKKVEEEFKKLEEEAAKPLTNRLEAMRETTVGLAKAQAELSDRLEHSAHSQESLKEKTDKAVNSFRDQATETQRINDALMRAEMDGLESAHAQGIISEEKYAAARIEIEERYRKKKRDIEQQESMQEILAKKRTLELAEIDQPGLTASAQAALARQAKALEDLRSLKSDDEVRENRKATAANLQNFEKTHGQDTRWGDLIQQFASIGPGASTEEAEKWMQANYTAIPQEIEKKGWKFSAGLPHGR